MITGVFNGWLYGRAKSFILRTRFDRRISLIFTIFNIFELATNFKNILRLKKLVFKVI